jgi:hypothetical protein
MIQSGDRTKMAIMMTPNGFQNNAAPKSPFRIDSTDLVDPQEGQGIPVTRLNKQTPGSIELVTLR